MMRNDELCMKNDDVSMKNDESLAAGGNSQAPLRKAEKDKQKEYEKYAINMQDLSDDLSELEAANLVRTQRDLSIAGMYTQQEVYQSPACIYSTKSINRRHVYTAD